MARTMAKQDLLLQTCIFVICFSIGAAIQCYQCDSNEDAACPSNKQFDRNLNALVDCNSFEAHTPGTFCMKISQQSPGWRAWKKVTRRCGSRSDTGVAWGCKWVYEENGVWKETCYCEDRDGCNGAPTLIHSALALTIGTLFIVLQRLL